MFFDSIGLLVLRVGAGATMAIAHGLPKLQSFAEKSSSFPDPLGVGSSVSMALAIFGELVCGALIAAGLFTRLAAIPFGITMTVAAFITHGADPFQKKELALMYLVMAIAIALLGPGRWSLDQFVPPPLRRLAKV